MSIHPVNKAVLGRGKKEGKKALNAYLIKNSTGEGGGGGGTLSQAVARTGRSSMGI